MSRYAVIDGNKKVINIVLWDGEESWSPPENTKLVQTDDADIGWTYLSSTNKFKSPVTIKAVEPTQEDIVSAVIYTRDSLLSEASLKIAPLQDSVELGIATEEEQSLLNEWKLYRVELNRISKQEDFPNNIVWPVKPND